MDKLSEEKIAAVLTEVPGTLRALGTDRDQWRNRAKTAEGELRKVAQRERIVKIANELGRKGLDEGRSMDSRIELLEKKAEAGKLDAIEEALDWKPGSIPLGEIVEDVPGQAASDLEAFILGDLA